ncbi:hypothetical protein LX36DRAFT_489214 [Colletotrichum falcatum]|nr:hypothetical protein LX36DRAFT_489214 [Colletotrichum falcatum]
MPVRSLAEQLGSCTSTRPSSPDTRLPLQHQPWRILWRMSGVASLLHEKRGTNKRHRSRDPGISPHFCPPSPPSGLPHPQRYNCCVHDGKVWDIVGCDDGFLFIILEPPFPLHLLDSLVKTHSAAVVSKIVPREAASWNELGHCCIKGTDAFFLCTTSSGLV